MATKKVIDQQSRLDKAKETIKELREKNGALKLEVSVLKKQIVHLTKKKK